MHARKGGMCIGIALFRGKKGCSLFAENRSQHLYNKYNKQNKKPIKITTISVSSSFYFIIKFISEENLCTL